MKAPKTLGGRIKALRKHGGYTLQETAKEIGITKPHLWDLETGRSANPTLKTVLAICRVFDISIQDITEGLK